MECLGIASKVRATFSYRSFVGLFVLYSSIFTLACVVSTVDRYAQYEGWSGWAHNIIPEDIDIAWHMYLKGPRKCTVSSI